jgi:hypothetical protein
VELIMNHLAYLALCAVVSSAGIARADDDYEESLGPHGPVVGLEMALTVSPSDGARRDTFRSAASCFATACRSQSALR